MKQTVGKVIEVYIPKQYQNGNLLDVMDRNKIGFKVQLNNEISDIILDQDEFNSNIMKNDLVLVIEQTISGKKFIDIEQYEGEEND